MQYDFASICVAVLAESEKVNKKNSSFFYKHQNLPRCFHAVKLRGTEMSEIRRSMDHFRNTIRHIQ